MRSDLLHVVAVISNPMRWASRVRLFREFMARMLSDGVRLTVVECAYGDLPFEIAAAPGVNLVQVRTNSLAWIKENLINIGIARLPHDWKYVAWVDADIVFRHAHWASETVHALQRYPIIQPWADCYDLGPHGEHLEHHRSFARQNWHRRVLGIGQGYEFAHPGYAWAARRDALDRLGGLIETGVVGAGDHHMALALIGRVNWSIPWGLSSGYIRPLYQWQERAMRHLQGSVGFLPGSIEHLWHGPKVARAYIERWDIVRRNGFDPDTDLKRNTFSVLELAGNKPHLAQDLDIYMSSRDEDSNSIGPATK